MHVHIYKCIYKYIATQEHLISALILTFHNLTCNVLCCSRHRLVDNRLSTNSKIEAILRDAQKFV